MQSTENRAKDKQTKRSIRKDTRNYNTKLFQIALERNSSLKVTKQGSLTGK